MKASNLVGIAVSAVVLAGVLTVGAIWVALFFVLFGG